MPNLDAARLSLEGLSIGDSFGDNFFIHSKNARTMIASRKLPDAPWMFTDDTNMALSIYENLRLHGRVHQDTLAQSFATHYTPDRGYGAAMHGLLARIRGGISWQTVAPNLFDGQGSYGNGAAMRVAPIGAYFYDDLTDVIVSAHQSAEITHSHPEGIAGAIAVAVATAIACQLRGQTLPSRVEFIDLVLPHIPDSEVKSRTRRARDLQSTEIDHVIGQIGNGYHVSAQDTVPFVIWCAGESLSNFERAMWLTASGLGDVDTNCAMVGGIVACYVGESGLPIDWIQRREPLPTWALG